MFGGIIYKMAGVNKNVVMGNMATHYHRDDDTSSINLDKQIKEEVQRVQSAQKTVGDKFTEESLKDTVSGDVSDFHLSFEVAKTGTKMERKYLREAIDDTLDQKSILEYLKAMVLVKEGTVFPEDYLLDYLQSNGIADMEMLRVIILHKLKKRLEQPDSTEGGVMHYDLTDDEEVGMSHNDSDTAKS